MKKIKVYNLNMFLLAVSGGPDSMALLHEYKDQNIAVAHVNYNVRSTSTDDEIVVENFCLKYNIPFYLSSIDGTKIKGNFQNEARKIRYNFFKEICSKLKIEKVLMAHHKDDFIETVLMQKNSKRKPNYFGIKKNSTINGMNIFRPYIDKFWKNELIDYCNKNKVEFKIDVSNASVKYTRNKIRKDLSLFSLSEKTNLYNSTIIENNAMKIVDNEESRLYQEWESNEFGLKWFRCLSKNIQPYLAFKLIHNQFESSKLSSGKINSLVDFLNGTEGNKKFLIDKQRWIKKDKQCLTFEK